MSTGKEKLLSCALVFALLFLTGVSGCSSKSSDSSPQSSTPAVPSEPAAPAEPNAPAEPVAPAAANAADLLGTSLTFIPDGSQQSASEVTVGQKGTFNSTIFNAGGTDANNVLVRFEVEGANSGEATIPAISQGQDAQSGPVSYTFNETGLRTIRLVIDPNSQIPETNEENNGDLTMTVNVLAAGQGPAAPGGPVGGVVNAPAQNADLLGRRLYFVPDNSRQSVLQTTVGQRGTLFATASNMGNAQAAAVTGHIEVEGVNVGNINLGDIPAGQESVPGSTLYTFNAPGTYSLRLFVNAAPNETNIDNNNDATATIEVIDSAAPPEPPQPPQPPPEPAADSIDLIGSRLYFMSDDLGVVANQTTVGQPGTINAAVINTGSVTAFNVPIQVTDNDGPAGGTIVPSVPPGQSVTAPPIPYTFTADGQRTLRLMIASNDPRETNVGNNNDCTFVVNVLPAPGPGPDAVAGPLTFVKLAIKSTDTGQDYTDDVCYVDKPVTIYAQIQNNSSVPIADVVPVDIGMDNINFGTVPCSFGPNQTLTPGFSKTFTHPGRFKIYANVDQQDSVGRRDVHGKWITVKGATAAEAPLTFVKLAIKNADTGQDYPDNTCLTNKPVTVYAQIQNNNDLSVNDVPIEFGIDESIVAGVSATYSFWPDQTLTPGFGKTFTRPGTHQVHVTIDPQNTQNRLDSKTQTITVNSDRPEQVAKSVYCDRVGFWSNVSGRIEETVYTGDTGYVFAEITNRANQVIPNLKRVLKYNRVVVKDTGDQSSMPANSTITLKENDINRRMNVAGSYLIELDIDPDDRKGQKSHTQSHVNVRPAGEHHVSGELKFYVNGSADPTDAIGTNQTGRVNWIVRNQRWEEQRNVRVRVKVDGMQREDKTVNLNRSPGRADGWVENIKFDRIGSHSIILLIDEDKAFPKIITAIRPNVGGKIELYNQRGELTQRVMKREVCRIKYSLSNSGNTAVDNVRATVKVDNVVRKDDQSIHIGPSPAIVSGFVENVVFDSLGQHKIPLLIDLVPCLEYPVTVVRGEYAGFFGEIELYDRNGPTTKATTTGTYRIRYKAGFDMRNNTTPQQACLYVNDENKQLASTGVQFDPPFPDSEEHWVENVKFAGVGPHTIMLSITRGGSYTKVITVTDQSLADLIKDRPKLAATSGPKIGRSSDSEPKKPKPADLRAGDIGFIPNGAKDYSDEVYQGEKGSLYGAFHNDSDTDIKNLKVQILVDGQVVRESVKPLVRARGSADFEFLNYRFNTTGKHKVSLIVNPDNAVKESNEKDNRITHTVNVIRKSKPRTPAYDGANAAAVADLLGSLGKGKSSGGGNPPPPYVPPTYTPPTAPTPRVTTTTVDQGGSSSGTSAKKKVPVFTAKGLGK